MTRTKPLALGVVGFSAETFDQAAAREQLRGLIVPIVERERDAGRPLPELVSGLTNQGVPKLAYALARELGLPTVGISAKQALRARAGCFPVDRRILVGKRYGDESAAFVAMIDVLVRVGGGPQSRREVELFRQRLALEGAGDLLRCFEVEVEWFGR